jgi:hypothetical protein
MSAYRRHFGLISVTVMAAISAGTGCSKGGGTSGGQSAEKAVTADKSATPDKPPAVPKEPEAKPASATGEKITLAVNNFGVFGYKPLYAEYKQTHPNVEIIESVSEYNTHHSNLINHLATGSGAADIEAVIEAVDEGFMAQLKARPEQTASRVSNRAARSRNSHSLNRSRMPSVPRAE